MYLIICQVVDLIMASMAVLYFIGYWLSTDYYYNISKKEKSKFVIFLVLVAFFMGLNLFLGYCTYKTEVGIRLGTFCSGTIALGYIIVLTISITKTYFHKSRKYFANKRNRSI